MRISIILFLLVCTPGCLLDADEPERTYPGALDLELVTVGAVTEEVAVPGSYNVRAYVVGVQECPPDSRCFLPDHVTVSDQADPKGQHDVLMMGTEKPSQFKVGHRYTFSVEVESSEVIDPTTGRPVRRARLLGYDRLR